MSVFTFLRHVRPWGVWVIWFYVQPHTITVWEHNTCFLHGLVGETDSHFTFPWNSYRTALPLRSGFPEAPCEAHIQLDEYYLLALGLLSLEWQHSVPPAVANVCMGALIRHWASHNRPADACWSWCSGLYSIDRTGLWTWVFGCYGGKVEKGALI